MAVDEATRRYNAQYYQQHKKNKQRTRGLPPVRNSPDTRSPSTGNASGKKPPVPKKPPSTADQTQAAAARVKRLKGKIATLEGALTKANADLVKARAAARETEKANSDGKSTAKEKQSSEEYRDKHKEELKAKEKKEAPKEKAKSSSSSSSGGSSSSSSSSSSAPTVESIETRIIQIKSVLQNAKAQLSSASQKLGQLAHSAITSEPTFNEHFARFRSAEGIPSK